MGHNGPVLWGKKRIQRITVGLIVGLVVLSLALTLVGSALAAPGDAATSPRAAALAEEERTTSPRTPGLVSTDPNPVTETPQGTSTQVTDEEHIGGLVAFIAFMLGGVLLLLRGKRRERRERAALRGSESILSGH
jgi:hypothetical protein